MIGDKGDLPISISLSNVVTSNKMNELAIVFCHIIDAKHLLSPLFWKLSGKQNNGVLF